MNYPYKGALSNIPDFVVEEMLNQQELQGNKRDVTAFENIILSEKRSGGFDWIETIQGESFWERILTEHDFHLFLSWFRPTLLVSDNITDLPVKAEVVGYIKHDKDYDNIDYFITKPKGRMFFNHYKNAFVSTERQKLLNEADELIKQAQELREKAKKL